jgi:uncharacterized protein YbjT (DUF2867 family)
MADQHRVLVTGATGAQGGSVARHLLAQGRFAVRCLTRNPDSEKAAVLRGSGAEVVQGDLDDADSLRRALADCYGCFGVTNYWEHFEHEYDQGRNLIDAVADSGVQHFVLSTLPSVSKLTDGSLEVPHFETKARLEEYARERVAQPTFTHVAFYFENFLTFFPPHRQDDGSFVFGFPQGETRLAGVAVEDVGGVVAALFGPDQFKGQVVGIVGDDLPPAEYAAIMTRVLGKPIHYRHVPRETFAALGFPGAEDLANMFDFNRHYVPNRAEDLAQSRSLYPAMETFEHWVTANKGRFAGVLQ